MLKIRPFLMFLLLSSVLCFTSCYYDKADLLYPNSNLTECDTTTVSYAAKVVPLLSQQCYSCHTTASPGGGVVLGTYDTDKAAADNGSLSGVINFKTGFSPMPKGGNKMSTCRIAKIQRWIDAGAPNN